MSTGEVARLPAPIPVDDGTVEEVGRPGTPEIDWGDLGSVARGKWDKFFAIGDAELYESKVEPVNIAFEAIADGLRDLKTITEEIWPVNDHVPSEIRQLFLRWQSCCEPLLLVHTHAHWRAGEMPGALVSISGVSTSKLTKQGGVRVYKSYTRAKAEGTAAQAALHVLRNLINVAETVLGSCESFDTLIERATLQQDRSLLRSLREYIGKKPVNDPMEKRLERIRTLAGGLASAFAEIKLSVAWQIEFWTKLTEAMCATREVDMGIIIPSRNELWLELYSRGCTTSIEGSKLFNSGRLAAGQVDFTAELSVPPKIEW